MDTQPQLDDPDAVPATIDDPRRQRAILLTVCIALIAVIASVSGLNVAQPDLAVALDASQSTVLWMINTYTVTMAALLLPLGAMGDRIGRKPVLLTGLLLFGMASAMAGLAPSSEVMIAARLLSGVGAAMIMPVTLAVITSTFPDEERSRAIGVWTAVAGGGGILGMYLSAVLVDLASWRWLFALPVALVAVAELRQPEPLLDIRLFRQRGLASGSVALLAVFGVQAGIMVVLFPFFQAVLGWSGLQSTLALMPMALLMMIASGLAPRVAARVGAQPTMAAGIALGGMGVALMARLVSVDGGYMTILPGMLAMGLGMGLSTTPSTEAITTALPRSRQGVASALNDVTRELGSALGVALLGATLSSGYRAAIDTRLDGLSDAAADSARDGVANAIAAAGDAGVDGQTLVRAAQEAFVDGWHQSMWAGVAVMAVLFLYVVVRGPRATAGDAASDTLNRSPLTGT